MNCKGKCTVTSGKNMYRSGRQSLNGRSAYAIATHGLFPLLLDEVPDDWRDP